MNQRLLKKYAYYLVYMGGGHEETANRGSMIADGFEATEEEVEQVTNFAIDIREELSRKSEGWLELLDKHNSKRRA